MRARRITSPIRRALEQGPLGGVFFLWGEDEHRKAEAVNEIVAAHLEEATRDFNFDVLRGSEVKVEDLARIAATPPLMADWRVVVVRGAEAFATTPRARDLVLGLAKAPPAGLALVLTAQIPPRSRAKFYTQLKRGARSLEFSALHPDDVPGWLVEEARSRFATTLEPEAARALAHGIGTDLGILSRELEKLEGLAGEGRRITVEHVRIAGAVLPEQDRWGWFDLVGGRSFDEALGGLRLLLGQGESGVGLTAGLATHLLRIGVALEQGQKALEQLLPPRQRWLASRIARQARGWSPAKIRKAILGLLRVDLLLKTSSLSSEHLLEEWVLAVMTPERAVSS